MNLCTTCGPGVQASFGLSADFLSFFHTHTVSIATLLKFFGGKRLRGKGV